MDFYELVGKRQSCRAFDATRVVEPEKLQRILEAARLAPSACNAQPWHFVVVTEPALKDQVAQACSTKLLGLNHFTRQAPIHVLIVQESENFTAGMGNLIKSKNFAQIDIGIATTHIVLAAEAEGLGTCILGWFNESKIKTLLNIPRRKRVLLDILIGYSTAPIHEKKRKPTEQVVSMNKY